jgi:hypothetical protein
MEENTEMSEIEIGHITDFFARPVVAGISLTDDVKLGDTIHIQGHTTDMTLLVESMQIEGATIKEAKAGDLIGMKVSDRVRPGDKVYKVIE